MLHEAYDEIEAYIHDSFALHVHVSFCKMLINESADELKAAILSISTNRIG